MNKVILSPDDEKIKFKKNSDVVTLNTAKYLKRNGFNAATIYYYQELELPYSRKGLKVNKRRLDNNRYDKFIYSAPTRDELKKYFEKL